MSMNLITVPDPRLRTKSRPVETLDAKTVRFIIELADTLINKKDPAGVGLSAVQVGTHLRIFCTLLPPIYNLDTADHTKVKPELKIYINPEIVDCSDIMTFGSHPDHPTLEGCLSVPTLYGPVPRHETVKLKYFTLPAGFLETQDPKGASIAKRLQARNPELEEKTDVFANFYARVIQHEYDHLEGVLFTDYTLREGQELYFDNGDKLVPIPKPKTMITW